MNPHGAAILVFLATGALSYPVARVVLALYRRAVGRITRERTGPVEPPTFAPAPRPRSAGVSGSSRVRTIELSGAPPDAPPPFGSALAGPWRQAGIYALGGLAYAVTTTSLVFRANGGAYSRNGWIVFVAFHAWPIVLAAGIVLAATPRARLAAAGGYATLLVLLWQLPRLSGLEVQPLLSLAVAWSVPMLLPTVLVLAFTGRTLRAVGPMVLAFMTLALSGAQVALQLLMDRDVTTVASELAAGTSASAVVAAFVLMGFASFGGLGWGALTWIRRRYAGKRWSDQTITIDALWLLFTVSAALGYAWRSVGWAAASVLPFVAYKVVTIAAMAALTPRTGTKRPVTLCLLRVFGSRERSEALFRIVSAPWRHVGVVQLIGGTDLATSNLEPHEFLEFVTGRLRRLFVRDAEDLDRRVRELDLLPDRDGRYRVAEYLCFDDTWRMTVSRVVAGCDAVLMDLRGFSAANRGVVYELELLVETVPLSRLALLADATTDLAALEEALRGGWERIAAGSVNAPAAGPQPEVTLLLAPDGLDLVRRQILATLFRAAAEPAGRASGAVTAGA